MKKIKRVNNNHNWISVEDKNPETTDTVLAYDDTIVLAYYDKQIHRWYEENTRDALCVHYWMPLPNPPQK